MMVVPPDLDRLREARAQVGEPAGKSWGGDHFLVRQEMVEAIDFLLSVLDEGGRLEVVVPCEREGGIIHERADGSECPYYGHHVCDKCGWIDPEHKGEYVSCGERTVVWPPKEGER